MFWSIRLALKSILFLLLDTIITVCVAATDESASQSLATQSVPERPALSPSAGEPARNAGVSDPTPDLPKHSLTLRAPRGLCAHGVSWAHSSALWELPTQLKTELVDL